MSAIRIRVVLAFSTHHAERQVMLSSGATARQALQLAIEQGLPLAEISGTGFDALSVPIGVFGEQVDDDYVLEDGDRVEIYRPLQQDPKELRRHRAREDAQRQTQTKKR